MDDLRKALVSVAASLQVLAANTTANTQGLENMGNEVQMMTERNRQTEEAVQALQGTFASIETHLVKLFERDAEIRAWKDEQTKQWQDIVRRVEALEKRQPPAA